MVSLVVQVTGLLCWVSGIDSDAALGFVEPLEVLNVGDGSLGVEDDQPLGQSLEVPSCSGTSFSPHVAPVSATIVVHDESPPQEGSLIGGDSLRISSSMDPQMPSPLHEDSQNSDSVIPPVKDLVQDSEAALVLS